MRSKRKHVIENLTEAERAIVASEPISELRLSNRALQTCEKLGVATVGDLLDRRKEEFLAVHGCGERTWAELSRRARRCLDRSGLVAVGAGREGARQPAKIPEHGRKRVSRRGRKKGRKSALEQAPTESPTESPTEATGERVVRASESGSDESLLPQVLVDLPLETLDLKKSSMAHLGALDLVTVGDALHRAPRTWREGELGQAAADDLRAGLERILRMGLDQIVPAPEEEEAGESLTDTLVQSLLPEHRDHLRRRLGLGAPPAPLSDLAHSSGQELRQVLQTERSIRGTLQERAIKPLGRLRDEILRELTAFEGVVIGDRLAPGTLAHAVAKETGYPLLPLRVLAFCFPEEFHLHRDCLLALPAPTFRRFLERLRELTGPDRIPVKMADLIADLSAVVDPVPTGLLQYLLDRVCQLTVLIDERQGEVVTRRSDSVASRMHRILLEVHQPMSLLDLMFRYRENHRRARKVRLLTELRRDKTFLEVGKELWSLREWHQEDLEMAFNEADHAAEVIVSLGGRRDVREVLKADSSELMVYAAIDCLRRDKRVRYLGRGEFCPANSSRSAVLEGLARDFRRAMGEIPLKRFLDNADPERRRLLASLLHENRLFVEPDRDRIDLLSNYPFDRDRMRRTLAVVGEFLSRRDGYAPAEDLLPVLADADLGGGWLSGHMLIDILRRHGRFELLPGGLVAQPSLRLGGWIRTRAREAIRAASMPLTADEITAEVPELAEFAESLEELLERDPMLQSKDGMHFSIA